MDPRFAPKDLMELFGPKVTWVPSARWVIDGKFFTSSGVSAGTVPWAIRLVGSVLGYELMVKMIGQYRAYTYI